MKRAVHVFLLILFSCTWVNAQNRIHGYVFLDENANGIMDEGEKGVGGVLVSNQIVIEITDASGKYDISIKDSPYVFVVKPADYDFSSGWAEHFYVHADSLEDYYNFGLSKKEVNKKFSTLLVGDPQIRGEKTLYAFRDDIVTEMMHYDVAFTCFLGDIADNDLTIYPREKEIVSQLPYPALHLFGNHDIDEKATSAETSTEIFKEYFGPDYYSFNEGDVHFVLLNNVLYGGWDKEDDKCGNYFGGLTDTQHKWLEADLGHVDGEKLIVILSHIPFREAYCYPQDIKRLFSLLKNRKHLLALSGHLHTIRNDYFDRDNYWYASTPFQDITLGAACGGWWTGPMDERGLPVATCSDGSPNGYYRFTFEENRYQYEFIPANHRSDFQMRLTLPEGEELFAGRLHDAYLSINIFSATTEAFVRVTFDEKTEVMAENYSGIDPFMEQTNYLRHNFDNWQPKLEKTNHLWKILLPKNLSAGTHRIKVEAEDKDGSYYVGYKIIQVKY